MRDSARIRPRDVEAAACSRWRYLPFFLLKIACTLPVTICECERSCSVLRRLSNYMRATMGQERLSSVALLHIHYDGDIDVTKVVDRFAAVHPRHLEMTNMIYS